MKLTDYISRRLGTDDWAVRPDTRGGAVTYPASTRLISVADHDALCAGYLAQGGKLPAKHQRMIGAATRMRTGQATLADPGDLPGTHRRLSVMGPDQRRDHLEAECLIGRGHWYHPEPGTQQRHQISYMGITSYGTDPASAVQGWMDRAGTRARAMMQARRENRADTPSRRAAA